MSVSEVVSQAVTLTKQVIEAATPIAKQAYEVSLKVIQIDAAGSLLGAAALTLTAAALLTFSYKVWNKGCAVEKANPRADVEGYEIASLIAACIGVPIAAFGAFGILNIWNWVGVFAPDLWLAHDAIEKLIK